MTPPVRSLRDLAAHARACRRVIWAGEVAGHLVEVRGTGSCNWDAVGHVLRDGRWIGTLNIGPAASGVWHYAPVPPIWSLGLSPAAERAALGRWFQTPGHWGGDGDAGRDLALAALVSIADTVLGPLWQREAGER